MGGYSNTIVSAAQQNNVDPSLALAVAQAESGGQQFDSSGNVLTSPAGALGVMQLEPRTAAQYGADPSDPTENIDAGTAYLGDLLNQYGDTGTALAAYNWGPGNVSRAVSQYGSAPTSWQGHTVPAWFTHAPGETQNYVLRIMGSAAFGGVSAGMPGASLPSLVPPSGSSFSAGSSLAELVSPAAALPSTDLTPWLWGAAAVGGFLLILDMSNA